MGDIKDAGFTRPARQNDVDWLRVFAVLILITVHTAAIFDPFPVSAVKGKPNLAAALFAAFVHEWRLAIIFVVSGAGVYFALNFLSASQFVRMRTKRLLIPLIVGTLLVVPVQIYYWLFLIYPNFNESYLQFYKTAASNTFVHRYFGTIPLSLYWGHLWFLAYLWVDSLVALPFFVYLFNNRHVVSRLADFCERKGRIFFGAFPIILSELCLRTRWPGYDALLLYNDWANFTYYLIFFIYGFFIYSDERLRIAIRNNGKSAFFFGLVTSSIFLVLSFSGKGPVVGYNLKWFAFLILRGINSWFWVVTVLSFGIRFLNFRNKFLTYANEAIYPVYIVHLPLSTMIGYHIVRWRVGVLVQFAIILLVTIGCSLLVLELFIKPTNVTRFLFGLKFKGAGRPKPTIQDVLT